MPRRTAWRAWSPYTICFAMTFVSCTAQLPTRLLFFFLVLPLMAASFFFGVAFDDGQHVILFHDEVLLAIQRDLLARILAEQDRSPALTSRGIRLRSSVTFSLPAAMTVPCCGFSLAASG